MDPGKVTSDHSVVTLQNSVAICHIAYSRRTVEHAVYTDSFCSRTEANMQNNISTVPRLSRGYLRYFQQTTHR